MHKRLITSNADSKLAHKCPSCRRAHITLKKSTFADSPGLYIITPLSSHYQYQPQRGSSCNLSESYSSLLREVRAPNLNRTEQKEQQT